MTTKSIILTGFMGTGKTTVGRHLAALTGRIFIDTDEVIALRAGKDIGTIFDEDGAEAFRAMERELAIELAEHPDLVVATGGKMMLDEKNAVALGRGNLVVCLEASVPEILNRVRADGARRPLLEAGDPAARVQALLSEREEGYRQFPCVDTSGRGPQDVAKSILEGYDVNRAGLKAEQPHPTRLQVRHPQGSYDVVVGAGLLPRWSSLGPEVSGTIVAISDENVAPLFAAQLRDVSALVTIPAGEANKNLETVRHLYDALLAQGLDRSGMIIGLGGGVVGDIAGFVAATFMRGVPIVQCPTTLLAMVDASVGGKTGVDLPQGKNLIGAFKQPEAVLADVATLRTLPPAELAGGMAEVIKHGILSGGSLWSGLERMPWKPGAPPDLVALQSLIVDAIQVKRDVVQEDPFEKGRRALLNLGHTFAHAIERASGFQIAHGQAVAMGMVAAVALSARQGYAGPGLRPRVEAMLAKFGLPVEIPHWLTSNALWHGMSSDKKRQSGRLRFVLPRAIGDVFVTDAVARSDVQAALRTVGAG